MPVSPSDYKLKVMLGLPFAGRYVPPEWAVALATIAWPMNCRYAYAPCKGMVREEARTEIANRAIEHRAQYVAMLDDDIQPPADFLQHMTRELDSRPEFDIITAVCPSPSGEPMIFKAREMGPYWRWKKGQIFEIAECATACIMIRTSVFQSLPRPWFRDLNTIEERIAAGTIDPADGIDKGAMTDDIYFCRKATNAGHRILAHGGILPYHWDRKGNYAELAPDSFPFQSDTTVDTDPRVNIKRALAIEGWMTQEELEWLATEASRLSVKRIAEIGSWMGRSTRAFADNIQPDGIVYAIDTWEGSPECGPVDRLPVDWIYDQFRLNMQDHDGRVRAVKMSSTDAAAEFVAHNIEPCELFDLVFIDAAHDYDSVKADILAWRPLVRPGGILCGHDYDRPSDGPTWEGVVRAVNELVPGAKRGAGSIWYDVVPE